MNSSDTRIYCLGISHQTATVEIRERFAVRDLGEAHRRLALQRGIDEVVIVSTCNRVEIYCCGSEAAPQSARAFFAALSPLTGPTEACFYEMQGAEVAAHLFRVAAGMESMVVGETEILGQVKEAYRTAVQSGVVKAIFNKLFQRSFQVAKEVRTRTAITRGSVSVGSVAVDLAERIFGRLSECHVMIMGAGDTSEKTARALLSKGARGLFVSNRSFERAALLAKELGGQAIHFDQWEERLHEIDIAISSTTAPHYVVRSEQMAGIASRRGYRPLFLIDLAVPRDIDPAVDGTDGVYRYDIDALQGLADEALQTRRNDLGLCEEIVTAHTRNFLESLRIAQDRKRLLNREPVLVDQHISPA
ncbi:MAG: glutamyl-tRNA reductase [Verrucomicrobiia bacterium]